MLWEGKNSMRSPRLNYTVLIGGGTTVYPIITGSQEIFSPKGPTGSVEFRNNQISNTSINGNWTKNGDPTPTFCTPTSTCVVRQTSRVIPPETKAQTSWIWGFWPSTHQMNSGPLVPPLPELEGQQMYPTGARRFNFSENLQELEWVGQGKRKSMIPKLILKLWKKIRILGSKIFLWVDHFWTRLLLVQTQTTEQHHQLTWFLSGKKRHPYSIETTNGFTKSKRTSTYQRTQSQTNHCQIHHQTKLIFRMIAIPVNEAKINEIGRKSVRNTRNRTH